MAPKTKTVAKEGIQTQEVAQKKCVRLKISNASRKARDAAMADTASKSQAPPVRTQKSTGMSTRSTKRSSSAIRDTSSQAPRKNRRTQQAPSPSSNATEPVPQVAQPVPQVAQPLATHPAPGKPEGQSDCPDPLAAFEARIKERQELWTDVVHHDLCEHQNAGSRSLGTLCFQYNRPFFSNFVCQAIDMVPSQAYLESLKSMKSRPISGDSRMSVVSWMMLVHRFLREDLSLQTLHLGVNLMDRFFNTVVCKTSVLTPPRMLFLEKSLQAVGTSCLFIASKLEDPKCLDIEDCVTISTRRNPHTSLNCDDVLSWEMSILQSLEFKVNSPTSVDFLLAYLNTAPQLKGTSNAWPLAKQGEVVDSSTVNSTLTTPIAASYKDCALYMVELALLHHDTVVIPAHVLAATALCCVVTYLDNKPKKVSNLPSQVLTWLKAERQSGCLKDAAGKLASLLELRAMNSRPFHEVDLNHKSTSAYLLNVYDKWKAARDD